MDIIPAIRTDHSAITIHINGIEETIRGPSFWKFNCSLLEDEEYVKLITDKYSHWLEEGKIFKDPRAASFPYVSLFSEEQERAQRTKGRGKGERCLGDLAFKMVESAMADD